MTKIVLSRIVFTCLTTHCMWIRQSLIDIVKFKNQHLCVHFKEAERDKSLPQSLGDQEAKILE